MHLVLPLPPSSNTTYKKSFKTRRLYLSPEGKQWKTATLWELKKYKPLKAPIEMWINLYFPDLKVRDHWNYPKLPIDCLKESGLIEDDNWKINPDAHLHAELDKDNPRIEIIIKEIQQPKGN